MKEPKLIKRNRDRVYSIVFNQNNRHKYKSLGTKNKMEAEIVFTRITGFPVTTDHAQASITVSTPNRTNYATNLTTS